MIISLASLKALEATLTKKPRGFSQLLEYTESMNSAYNKIRDCILALEDAKIGINPDYCPHKFLKDSFLGLNYADSYMSSFVEFGHSYGDLCIQIGQHYYRNDPNNALSLTLWRKKESLGRTDISDPSDIVNFVKDEVEAYHHESRLRDLKDPK